MTKVEFAKKEDVTELADLLAILFSQEADFKPDLEKQKLGLLAIIENPDIGKILVLKDGPKIIGMVNLLFTISTALGGRVAILEDMIIHPSRRGNGDGTTLLKSAIEFAKKENCKRITLLTDLSNDKAIRFYKKQGFTSSAMTPLRLMLE